MIDMNLRFEYFEDATIYGFYERKYNSCGVALPVLRGTPLIASQLIRG